VSAPAIGLIGIAILFVILLARVPIGLGMALVGFAGFVVLGGLDGALGNLALIPQQILTSYQYAVIPLFVLMGTFATHSGLTRELYSSLYKWVGQFRGGLAMATVLACGGFAAMTGSGTVGAVTFGQIVSPEMRRYHYDPKLVSGCIAAGSTIGVLIPPSMGFILYGILTGVSIGKLFIAGIIPGVLEIVTYLVVIYVLCRRDPSRGPAGPKVGFKLKLTSLSAVLPVLGLFGLVMGGIYGGLFTPSEAGAIGAFGALVIALALRQLSRGGFVKALTDAARITGMVMLLVTGAFILASFLSISRLPFMLADTVAGLALPPYLILALILVAYILLGCAFDLLSVMVLTLPIIFPLIQSLGLNTIWYGVLMVRVLEVGAVTPPIGINSYVLAGVMKLPPETVFRGVIPFVIGDIFHIVLLAAVPQLSLFLLEAM
jgi:C4-dicarboxylate transporter DctM subunit